MFVPSSAEDKFLLRKAARMWGVQPDYTDSDKALVRVKESALVRILEALVERPITSGEVLKELIPEPRRKKIARGLAPVYVVKEGQPLRLSAYVPTTESASYEFLITKEDGSTLLESALFNKQRDISNNGKTFSKGYFALKLKLPVGYHQVVLKVKDSVKNAEHELAKSLIMCAPVVKPKPINKRWGAFAPLYGIRSEHNWGLGDLTDMEEFQDIIHKHGGSFFGTLPMLAAINEGEGADPSPYSPVSRLFWNEIYLDVQALAQKNPAAMNLIQEKSFQAEIKRLQDLKQTDQVAVMNLKKPVLLKLAEDFFSKDEDKSASYQKFLQQMPLVEKYAEFRAHGSKAERQYHLYVQYQMDLALKRLHEKAKTKKTAGLYLDFPVGTSRGGFDSVTYPKSFIDGLNAGAPPDAMFRGGQNWGFAPLHPNHIREEGYQYFIQCMRQHMRYADILRLDHVMAFLRIYTVPAGVDAKSGGYVRFHPEEFFALLAIESERFGIQVVGEDLGTVPPAMRILLDENQSLGMWVLPFEAGSTPKKAIAQAKPRALACINTHDMIPFHGFLDSKDNTLFEKLGVLDPVLSKQWSEGRAKDLKGWIKDFNVNSKEELLEKILEAMAAGPSELLLINIEDLWQEEAPQNVPGTWKEYANWRRKLRLSTKDWAHQAKYTDLLDKITELRKQKKA